MSETTPKDRDRNLEIFINGKQNPFLINDTFTADFCESRDIVRIFHPSQKDAKEIGEGRLSLNKRAGDADLLISDKQNLLLHDFVAHIFRYINDGTASVSMLKTLPGGAEFLEIKSLWGYKDIVMNFLSGLRTADGFPALNFHWLQDFDVIIIGRFINEDTAPVCMLKMLPDSDGAEILDAKSLECANVVTNFLSGIRRTSDDFQAFSFHWLQYTAVVITGSGKAGFLQDENLMNPFERGSTSILSRKGLSSDCGVPKALYVEDHIHGRILQTQKVLGWSNTPIIPTVDREVELLLDPIPILLITSNTRSHSELFITKNLSTFTLTFNSGGFLVIGHIHLSGWLILLWEANKVVYYNGVEPISLPDLPHELDGVIFSQSSTTPVDPGNVTMLVEFENIRVGRLFRHVVGEAGWNIRMIELEHDLLPMANVLLGCHFIWIDTVMGRLYFLEDWVTNSDAELKYLEMGQFFQGVAAISVLGRNNQLYFVTRMLQELRVYRVERQGERFEGFFPCLLEDLQGLSFYVSDDSSGFAITTSNIELQNKIFYASWRDQDCAIIKYDRTSRAVSPLKACYAGPWCFCRTCWFLMYT